MCYAGPMKTKFLLGFLALSLLVGGFGWERAEAATLSLAGLRAQLESLQAQLNALKLGRAPAGPQIDSIKTPINLKANEPGTWMFRASRLPVGVKVNYQTSWGDEPSVSIMQVPTPANGQIFIHFRHTYQKSGTYTQHFTISAP